MVSTKILIGSHRIYELYSTAPNGSILSYTTKFSIPQSALSKLKEGLNIPTAPLNLTTTCLPRNTQTYSFNITTLILDLVL